jgi:3-methyladenine DNA glycosylase/8-oxoguanine DNA glycosylase
VLRSGQFELTFTGDYDLDEASRFLEGWPPTAGASHHASSLLQWATSLDGEWNPLSITIRQQDHRLTCSFVGASSPERVATEAARVLSLDVDASKLNQVIRWDPVAGRLLRKRPGLRPVCFWSPYEAAVWGVLSQRSSMAQASRIKSNITRDHGIEVGDGCAFPPPQSLRAIAEIPGIGRTKLDRLHHIAEAALDGSLSASMLRQEDVDTSLDRLADIPGVGPFTAELILVRGAGHPDVFPRHERRLHAIMKSAYGLTSPGSTDLEMIAEGWRPYRSWIGFLFRSVWEPSGN